MQQLAVWTMHEEVGFGSSLQHYNPLIDNWVYRLWALPESWRLIALLPFGKPLERPVAKAFKPLENRLRVFR